MLIIVACVVKHSFIRQEVRKDRLLEENNPEDLIIIDNYMVRMTIFKLEVLCHHTLNR